MKNNEPMDLHQNVFLDSDGLKLVMI